jgi:hypothetical protein
VRQRYLSPKLLQRWTRLDLDYWGRERTLDEFHSVLLQHGFDLKTQCITPQILGRWARGLGMETGSNPRTGFTRKGYTLDEVHQLDDLYRGVHLIGMSHYEYQRDVVRKGRRLDDFLKIIVQPTVQPFAS